MKRVLLTVSLAIICLAAVSYSLPRYWLMHEASIRHAYQEADDANQIPLVLDAKTQAILTVADRVETFRLVDFHEEVRYSEAERAALDEPHVQFIGDHQVQRKGPLQNKLFASALQAALAETPGFIGKDGKGYGVPSCFDPGVGFRVWKGQAHVDLCVCFYCTAIEIDTKDPSSKFSQQILTNLGKSRPAFLALSKKAFPQDARLAALN